MGIVDAGYLMVCREPKFKLRTVFFLASAGWPTQRLLRALCHGREERYRSSCPPRNAVSEYAKTVARP